MSVLKQLFLAVCLQLAEMWLRIDWLDCRWLRCCWLIAELICSWKYGCFLFCLIWMVGEVQYNFGLTITSASFSVCFLLSTAKLCLYLTHCHTDTHLLAARQHGLLNGVYFYIRVLRAMDVMRKTTFLLQPVSCCMLNRKPLVLLSLCIIFRSVLCS